MPVFVTISTRDGTCHLVRLIRGDWRPQKEVKIRLMPISSVCKTETLRVQWGTTLASVWVFQKIGKYNIKLRDGKADSVRSWRTQTLDCSTYMLIIYLVSYAHTRTRSRTWPDSNLFTSSLCVASTPSRSVRYNSPYGTRVEANLALAQFQITMWKHEN